MKFSICLLPRFLNPDKSYLKIDEKNLYLKLLNKDRTKIFLFGKAIKNHSPDQEPLQLC